MSERTLSYSELVDRVTALQTAAEQAYGMLWREHNSSAKAIAARKILLAAITKQGQARGIAHAIAAFGPTTETEVLNIEGF